MFRLNFLHWVVESRTDIEGDSGLTDMDHDHMFYVGIASAIERFTNTARKTEG